MVPPLRRALGPILAAGPCGQLSSAGGSNQNQNQHHHPASRSPHIKSTRPWLRQGDHFSLGSDDKSISTLDSYGVMYVAIQSQVEELKDWNQQMADRDAKIGELEDKSAEIDQLKSELCAICEQISQLPPSR